MTNATMPDLNLPHAPAEKTLELALTQAQISYCKPDQLIGGFEGNPTFIVPKYKVAIFLNADLPAQISAVYSTWNLFGFDAN
ncbi:MAG: hypothetical protein EAZ80_07890, partial [Runella slithyformis]